MNATHLSSAELSEGYLDTASKQTYKELGNVLMRGFCNTVIHDKFISLKSSRVKCKLSVFLIKKQK